jgi:hypothetical protein
MKVLVVYSRLYGDCARKAARGIAKSPWTLLLPVGFLTAFELLSPFFGAFGIVGGFIAALVMDAIFSAYLYFVGETVSDSKVQLGELKRAFGAYFWSVLNLAFVVWVARLLLSMVLRQNPSGGTLMLLFYLAAFVLVNAAPEIIYQRGSYGGMQTIRESLSFIQANWIEWFLPNIAFGALLVFAWMYSGWLGQSLVVRLFVDVVLGAIFHAVMVFRGHLFAALVGSSHRQRMFKYRNDL